MPTNSPPPTCPKCHKAMKFVLVKTGGRKFRCLDCDCGYPLRSPDVLSFLVANFDPWIKPVQEYTRRA